LSNFGCCGKSDWSGMYFCHCWDSNKHMQIPTWNPKFKSTCVDFQEKAKWSMFCVWIICSWIPWWLLGILKYICWIPWWLLGSWKIFVGTDGGV
jgi:hypothetical protein